ncbi:MAG: hypothetical protein IRZ28_07870 [Steroidobacteraceae bacterium]|nr:hypothetical protein [Steroidobacteraceae bacterium]
MKTVIHVAGCPLEISPGLHVASDIYSLAQIDHASHYLLLERNDDRDVPLKPSDFLIVSGDERLSVASGAYPAEDDPILRKPLSLVINEVPLKGEQRLSHSKLTFDELAALDPHFEPGDGVFIELEDIPDAQVIAGMRVVVQDHDRFYTSPAGNVGFNSALAVDLEHVSKLYGEIERTDENARSFIVVRKMPLPSHWNREHTDVLIIVPQGYPMAALDMFWVTPGLALADGRAPQNADLIEQYAGNSWQRFSWHYPPNYRWHPPKDNLLSHLRFVRTRLNQAH